MEAEKTLTNEEVIRELLELLKKNTMKEQANDVFEICSYVDGLEKKIDSMMEELTNMQNQIKEMQEDSLINNAKKALSEAQERLKRAERGSLLPLEMNACLPGCVWNATPRSLSPLERNIGFWTQA